MTEKPLWTVSSGSNIGTILTGAQVTIPIPVLNPPVESNAPYPPCAVPVEIYQFEDYKTANINSAKVDRFIGNASAFADVNEFWIKSNGLPITYNFTRFVFNPYVAKTYEYVFKIPRQRTIAETKNPIRTSGFIGVAINGVPLSSPQTGKIHRYGNTIYTENDVLNPINYPTSDGSGLIDKDGKFYYNSDPKLLYDKDITKHSPIIGYSFDGWPIYGPYSTANANGTGDIVQMTSSYRIKSDLRVNGTTPDGSFIEDYEYVPDLGTLDEYNGRDCITPEYPNGVYAYFVTVNPYNTDEPIYPYFIGPKFKSKPFLPNGNNVYPGDMSLSVISSRLPPGLYISGNNIKGSAYSVKTDSNFKFVIRAKNSTGISDITLNIKVQARTGLLWETPAGLLPVGKNDLIPIPMQFNPNFLGPDLKLTNNNLTLTALSTMLQDGNQPSALSTYAIRIGDKVMFSLVADKVVPGEFTTVGLASSGMDLTTYLGNTADSIGFFADGSVEGAAGLIYYASGYPSIISGDIVDMCVDRQNYLVWIRVNGGLWNNDPNQNPVTATGGVDISFVTNDLYPGVSCYNNGTIAGQFLIKTTPHYAVPYGFTFVGDDIKGDVYYALDNSLIEFQLSVVDQNIALSPNLNFYIPPNGGALPLGISLSPKGLLYGFTQPIFTKVTSTYNGNYDMNLYDANAYDYGVRPNNGYDSFIYDLENYDFFYDINIPKKLNRYYEFIVRATDGYFYEDRKFKIYVVGDDHFRSDTTYITAGTNFYRADITYLRKPIWLTPNYLGIKRANNYVTLKLEVYTSDSLVGIVSYLLEKYNDDGSSSTLPIGFTLDEQTGILYGAIPYQPAISKTYKFTIKAFRYDPIKGDTLDTARTFTLDIIGDVEATITFTTSGDLGYINAGIVSTLGVSANTKIKNGKLIYKLTAGKLPPGLILFNDGTIQGKVNQFSNEENGGLTTYDKGKTSFDGGTTKLDRQFIFTVKATDELNLSSVTKTFSIEVATPTDIPFSNVYVKPFLNADTRINVLSFFNNINIFTPNLIYRPNDINFGVQTELKMLLYPGIQTVEAAQYASAFGRSYRKQFRLGDVKKASAKIPGTNTVVYEVVYVEVFDNQENQNGSMASVVAINNRNYPITVNQGRSDAIDGSFGSNIADIEKRDVYRRMKLADRALSADYNGQKASDKNKSTIFGNSVTNIRNNLDNLGQNNRDYLPLWMRTPQTFSGVVQSFTKAIVLCYCVEGGGDTILLNIKYSGFDFKTINYSIDRAIIDSVAGSTGDKYLMFPAREVING